MSFCAKIKILQSKITSDIIKEIKMMFINNIIMTIKG